MDIHHLAYLETLMFYANGLIVALKRIWVLGREVFEVHNGIN